MPIFKITDPSTGISSNVRADRAPTEEEAIEYLASPKSLAQRLPPELTTIPGQTGVGLTRLPTGQGVSFDRSLSPEEMQRQLELEVFATQNPGRARTAQLGRFALETGGGLVGALPGAPAGPIGAVATGGLGFAGGKQLADILEMSLGTPRGRELAARTPTEGVTEVGKDVALGTVLEGVIRGGGSLGRKSLELTGNIPGNILRTGSSPESQEIARQLAARNVQVTPAMATGAPLMRGTEAALESFPFSGSRLAKEFETIENQFAQAKEGALTSMGPKQGDIYFGEKLGGMLKQGDKLSREGVRTAYDAPQAIVGDQVKYKSSESAKEANLLLTKERQLPAPLREEVALLRDLAGVEFNSLKRRFASSKDFVKNSISNILKKEFPDREIQDQILTPEGFKSKRIEELLSDDRARLEQALGGDKYSKAIEDGLSQLKEQLQKQTPQQLGFIAKQPTQFTLGDLSKQQFEELSEDRQQEIIKLLGGPKASTFNWPSLVRIRARVNNLIDSARNSGDLESAKVLEDLNSGIRKDLKGFADKYGAGEAIDAADEAFVTHQQVFSDPRMVKLLSADPESFKRLIARGESSNLISNIKNVVGEEGFAPIKRTFAEKIFSAKNPLEEFGDDTLKAVFNPSELRDLKSFIKQAEFLNLQKPTETLREAKGAARKAINFSNFGVTALTGTTIAGAVAGGPLGALTAITVPPAVVAKLWLSPTGRRYLMEGVKIPAGSPAANRISNTIRGLVASGSALESVVNEEEPSLDNSIQQSLQGQAQ